MGADLSEAISIMDLVKAHSKLTNSPPNGSVSHIATRCGFNDLSRFASFYRNRFGENPSETLKKIQ